MPRKLTITRKGPTRILQFFQNDRLSAQEVIRSYVVLFSVSNVLESFWRYAQTVSFHSARPETRNFRITIAFLEVTYNCIVSLEWNGFFLKRACMLVKHISKGTPHSQEWNVFGTYKMSKVCSKPISPQIINSNEGLFIYRYITVTDIANVQYKMATGVTHMFKAP